MLALAQEGPAAVVPWPDVELIGSCLDPRPGAVSVGALDEPAVATRRHRQVAAIEFEVSVRDREAPLLSELSLLA